MCLVDRAKASKDGGLALRYRGLQAIPIVQQGMTAEQWNRTDPYVFSIKQLRRLASGIPLATT